MGRAKQSRLLAALFQDLPNMGWKEMAETELALHIADFLICPAWVLDGILLWRQEALGYVAGLGLLFQASMLFIALILFLLLQPLLTTALFARGVVSRRSTPSA